MNDNLYYLDSFRYERNESAYGIVTSRCRKGAFISLENDEVGFCPEAGNIPTGTKVIVTVRKTAMEEKRCILGLDSVCSFYEIA